MYTTFWYNTYPILYDNMKFIQHIYTKRLYNTQIEKLSIFKKEEEKM